MAKLNRFTLLGFPYYFSIAIGLFPGKLQPNKTKTDCCNGEWPFKVTLERQLAGFISWMVTTFSFIYIISMASQKDANYFDLTELFQHISVQIGQQILFYTTFIHSRKRIVKCFNIAYHILQQTRFSKKIPLKVVLVTIANVAYIIVVYTRTRLIQQNYMFCCNTCIGIILTSNIDFMLTGLCSVAQYAFEDINHRLQDLVKVNPQPHQIEELVKFHWKVGQYVDNLSKCFGPVLLVLTISVIFWMILTTVATIKTTKVDNFTGNTFYSFSVLLFVISKSSIICISSQIVYSEAQRPKHILQCMCVGKEIPEATMEWIQLFDTQIDLRKVYLSACSSFDINISLLVNIFNIVITYTVCLLQMA